MSIGAARHQSDNEVLGQNKKSILYVLNSNFISEKIDEHKVDLHAIV